ncbi:MAG: D-aminoacylase [Planctomycetes bacterium]|nr:D-aminoacylase [Planctomycetota bacterium]
MDLILRNGYVLDGTGAPAQRADVGVQAGRIAEVGPLPDVPGVPCLDVRGLVVAPGFIDIHSHSDFTLMVDPRAVSSITQGVTLEVVGNCGHGCAPVRDPDLARTNLYGCLPGYEITWRTLAEYLECLQKLQPAVNVAALVPNGCLRLAAAGLVDRPSTVDEMREMKTLLAQGLEEGAFGFSTGLEYGPERACPEDEIVELCKAAANYPGFYATHTRNRMGEPAETIAEAIRTSAAAGIPLQISHLAVVARLATDGRRAVEDALEQVDEARRQGQDVALDMHTRQFGTTHLSAALPPWALEGDRSAVMARLREPAARDRMKGYSSIVTALARGDWSRIVLYRCHAQPGFSGKSIAEIGRELGLDGFDTVCEILSAEIEHLHDLMILGLAYQEDDLRLAFEHPCCMPGSDATALGPDGPLRAQVFHGAYTWAAWFFRHFVRETRTLTMEEAVRRLTSLPAQRLGLGDRGLLRRGAWADLAVFDPMVFSERGTILEPNQLAAGMTHVLVNGVVALKDGHLTGRRAGRVLRRGNRAGQ